MRWLLIWILTSFLLINFVLMKCVNIGLSCFRPKMESWLLWTRCYQWYRTNLYSVKADLGQSLQVKSIEIKTWTKNIAFHRLTLFDKTIFDCVFEHEMRQFRILSNKWTKLHSYEDCPILNENIGSEVKTFDHVGSRLMLK